MNTLVDILSYRREHDSEGEKQFIKDYLAQFEPVLSQTGEVIAYRYENLIDGAKTKILWTSHIDTVHHTKPEQVKQKIWVDDYSKVAFVDQGSDCLGADDGTGVWLMLEMIKHNVHGSYLFFRGEEKGCIGSKIMATEYKDYLSGFDCAIAFDRKGESDIITYQQSSRCCSDEFGNKLATIFSTDRDNFKINDGGIYTDTAEFVSIIPECTNISVGYLDQHSYKEIQKLDFAERLRDTLINTKWHEIDIPIERDPAVTEYLDYGYGYGYAGMSPDFDFELYENFIFADEVEIENMVRDMDTKQIAKTFKEMANYINTLEMQGW